MLILSYVFTLGLQHLIKRTKAVSSNKRFPKPKLVSITLCIRLAVAVYTLYVGQPGEIVPLELLC